MGGEFEGRKGRLEVGRKECMSCGGDGLDRLSNINMLIVCMLNYKHHGRTLRSRVEDTLFFWTGKALMIR